MWSQQSLDKTAGRIVLLFSAGNKGKGSSSMSHLLFSSADLKV